MIKTFLTHTRTIEKLRQQAALFCAIRHIDDLEALLGLSEYELNLLSLNPKYNLFTVPKRDGSKRWIEDPEHELQQVQDKLNDFLQSAYYPQRSDAAYGFMLCPKGDSQPRHIVTNAARHLGAPWLFNADIEDFFHQVKFERVYQVFKGEPFTLEDDLAQLLTRLTTHQERLPMGAPTSPVLSNFATVKLDHDLQQLANWAGWTYTRYADDMVFSSQNEITSENIQQIRQIIEDEGYTLKEQKLRLKNLSMKGSLYYRGMYRPITIQAKRTDEKNEFYINGNFNINIHDYFMFSSGRGIPPRMNINFRMAFDKISPASGIIYYRNL